MTIHQAFRDMKIGRRKFIIRAAHVSFVGGIFSLDSRGEPAPDDSKRLTQLLEETPDGQSVEIPAGRYILDRPLVLRGRSIKIFGKGRVDLVTTASNNVVIVLENSKDLVIDGLNVLAVSDCRAGISLRSCGNIRLSNIVVKNFREAGIEIEKSSGCTIDRTKFYTSAADPRWLESASSDIAINGTNSNISISNCLHASSGGYAIQVRTNRSGERSIGHVISSNYISGYNSYGIMLYRNGPYYLGDNQAVSGVVIRDNVIRAISGNRPANTGKPNLKDFGAGIYLQGAESCVVEGNVIDGANTSTNTELLAPGAIGIANAGAGVVRNNRISNCLYGIYINDSLGKGRRDGVIDVSGNTFRSVKKLCVKIVAKDNVNISGSSYDSPPERFMQRFGGHANIEMRNIRATNNRAF